MGKQKLQGKRNLITPGLFLCSSNDDAGTKDSTGTRSTTEDSTLNSSDSSRLSIVERNIECQGCRCVPPPSTKSTEFFLPKRLPCSCGASKRSHDEQDDDNDDKKKKESKNNNKEPQNYTNDVMLEHILRPWQVKFLDDTFTITKASQFVALRQNIKTKLLVKCMMVWLKKKKILKSKNDKQSKKACVVALHIWDKSCKVVLRHSNQPQEPQQEQEQDQDGQRSSAAIRRRQQRRGSLTKALPDSKLDPFVIEKEVPALSVLKEKNRMNSSRHSHTQEEEDEEGSAARRIGHGSRVPVDEYLQMQSDLSSSRRSARSMSSHQHTPYEYDDDVSSVASSVYDTNQSVTSYHDLNLNSRRKTLRRSNHNNNNNHHHYHQEDYDDAYYYHENNKNNIRSYRNNNNNDGSKPWHNNYNHEEEVEGYDWDRNYHHGGEDLLHEQQQYQHQHGEYVDDEHYYRQQQQQQPVQYEVEHDDKPVIQKDANFFVQQINYLEREHDIHEELLYITDTFEAAFSESGSRHGRNRSLYGGGYDDDDYDEDDTRSYISGLSDRSSRSSFSSFSHNSTKQHERKSRQSLSKKLRSSFRNMITTLQEEQRLLDDNNDDQSIHSTRSMLDNVEGGDGIPNISSSRSFCSAA